VHLDNAPVHNSKRSLEVLQAIDIIRMPLPASSPNTSPSDLYVFGNLTEKLQSIAVMDQGSLISMITDIFSDPPPDELIEVCQNWMRRLCQVTKNGGQYDRN
jgi:hypothetical protein